ncbi:uncharacterized protein LOC143376165 [Andrena cerasifolii]|uniref:uncharacterized protein LOC143376165 n=1 Tax=Andrena cerasifolii TaxID=2819439 RepID=UPI0040383661
MGTGPVIAYTCAARYRGNFFRLVLAASTWQAAAVGVWQFGGNGTDSSTRLQFTSFASATWVEPIAGGSRRLAPMTGTGVLLALLLVWLSRCLAQALENGNGEESEARNTGSLIESPSRRARALVFPKPGELLLIFGLGTPLQLDRESIIIGFFSKIVYEMPSNATDYTAPGVYYARKKKSRWDVYKTLEKVAEIYGLGGKACLLKAICEAASAPFDGRHGLLGQLLQVFFKPSSTEEEYDEYRDREYRAAESLGGQVSGENCHALYPECRRSVLEVFSTVIT